MDGNSIEYLFQERLLNDVARNLLKGLLHDKIIEEIDYAQSLKSVKGQIWKDAFQDYDLLKDEIKRNGPSSHYFKSKTEWLEFAARIGKHPRGSQFFPDTEESVRNNLSRIIEEKLIPRDYRFLKENIIDVNCLYSLSSQLGLPVHCWADWAHYYDFKSESQMLEIMRKKTMEGKIVLRLWKLMFPRLDLHRVPPDAFRKMLDSGVVIEIRNFVEASHLTPEKITPEWYTEIKTKAARDKFAIRLFQVFSFCASCIIGLTSEPIAGIAMGATSFFGEKTLRCLERYKNRLTYTFQEALEIIGEHADF